MEKRIFEGFRAAKGEREIFLLLNLLMSDFKTAEISEEEEDGPLEISDLGDEKQLDLRKS